MKEETKIVVNAGNGQIWSYCFPIPLGTALDQKVRIRSLDPFGSSYPTTIWVRILTQIYVFLALFRIFAFDLETFISKNWKNILFYQKFVHFGENTFPYCCWIFAVHVYVNVFL